MDDNLDIKTLRVCRTCMEEITNIAFFHLDFAQVNTEPTIRQKLSNCIPELDLSSVQNAIICGTCAVTINIVYNFNTKCHRSELQIHKYIQQLQHTGDVDLAEVAKFNQLRYEFLSTEFWMKDIEVTGNLYQEEPTVLNDGSAFNKRDDAESTNNQYLLSLQEVDMECVLFNTGDGLLNYSNPATEENSNTYDNSNILQNCITPQMVDNRDDNIYNLGTTDTFYECYTCGHKTKSKLKLILHMKSHTGKKWQQKKTCALKKYNTVLQRHIKKNQNSITFNKINKNGKGKCNSHSYSKNVRKSRSNLLQKYLKPNRQFGQHDDLNSNIEAMTNKRFKCSICEYRCKYKYILNKHMIIHIDDKPFKCSVCEYKCIRKGDLKKHMSIHTSDKPFKCSVCEYKCIRKGDLKKHMPIHTSDKPFKCLVCKYECIRKGDLKRHMPIHTGEKPFQCFICEFQFRRKSHLKAHVQIHIGEKQFTCSVCKYQCIRKCSLKRHMLIHSTEKAFKCSVCVYQCKRKNDLKRHMKIHTEEIYDYKDYKEHSN